MVGEMADVMFLKVDVDECEDIAMKYGISSMPTFVFIKTGAQVCKFLPTSKLVFTFALSVNTSL